jgi:hypothetical protein
MKISVDNVDLFELSEIQKKVIKNDVDSDLFEEDMKRRLEWVLKHKYERCFKRLKAEWDKKLAENGVESVPTDPDAYAQLVFSQPNYKDCKARNTNVIE